MTSVGSVTFFQPGAADMAKQSTTAVRAGFQQSVAGLVEQVEKEVSEQLV